MIPRTLALLVALLVIASAWSFAQAQRESSDPELTVEQWQQRVQDARRRSEEFVANARTQTPDPQASNKEGAEVEDQRAMKDPSLQRRDISSTRKGFYLFVGRDSDHHRPGLFADFRLACSRLSEIISERAMRRPDSAASAGTA